METEVTVGDARTYLGDFLPVDTVKSMDDAAVLSHHKQFSTAVAKHAPKNDKPYYEGFQNAEVRDWIKSMPNAYPTPESVAAKAYNLEKFLGAEKAGRGVILPKSDAKPEEWKTFFQKSGLVPEKNDGYKVNEKLAKDPFTAKFREFAHGVGMPSPVFEAVTGFIAQESDKRAQESLDKFSAQADREMTELETEWGDKYDANAELGQRAASTFIPHKDKDELEEILTKMEGVLGTKFTMQLWANIGKGISEHAFVMGDAVMHDGSMTVESARAQVRTLMNDAEFAAKLSKGDAESVAKWNKLNAVASGGKS